MNCPTCKVSLVISERSGVEIDYCPQCRGVWLDRGELDKILDRSGEHDRPGDRDERRHSIGHSYKKKKRESFLSELFDF